jgi:hypothetical protein
MAMITADPQDVPKVESFSFTPESMAKVNELIANYPAGPAGERRDRRARPGAAPARLAAARGDGRGGALLDMAPIRVYEIATFYTMFQLKPKGKYLLQVCTTTPCWLRGSEAVMKACQEAADGDDLLGAGGRVPRRLRERAGRADQRRFLRGPRRASTKRVLDAFRRGETPKARPADRPPDLGAGRRPTTLKGE